ncbi:hypothetical protein MMC13_005453 [Lambiella insularis]|nr:hypothetical protein [Lambiella insularis]
MSTSATESCTCGPADGHSPFKCARFDQEDCLKYCWVLSPDAIELFHHACQQDPEAIELKQFLVSRMQTLEGLEVLDRRIAEFDLIDQEVPKALWDEYVAKLTLAFEYNHTTHALQAAGIRPWVQNA